MFVFFFLIFITNQHVTSNLLELDFHTFNNSTNSHKIQKFALIDVNWSKVKTPFTIAVWLLLASVAKILFHVNKKFGDAIPDSALLIVVGLLLGHVLKHLNLEDRFIKISAESADLFFLYLLPPIIFDAGYFMPNRQLFENFDSVLLFAIVGTIFNAFAIGTTLFVLCQLNWFKLNFSIIEIFLFTSLISAVDPVAVISVFEEIHVNAFLFVNVFGEALFNDGVSVVLYQIFSKIYKIELKNMSNKDFFYCTLSFFVISFGGILIGLFYAIFVSLATRFSSRVKIVAPVFIFVLPYLAFLTAELFEMSSILAISTCGIIMKQYVKGNVNHNVSSSVKYFVKTLAQCSETVVFMFLGLTAISNNWYFDAIFVTMTIVLCLIFRCIGVIVQCAALNRFRKKKFSLIDQFVLSYGGLRGAIAFGLAVYMPNSINAKQMFVTTCIVVIFFTVFIQGITIRPLLHWLKVETTDKERNEKLIEKIYSRYCDYTMAGLEDIIGIKGANSIRDTFERFNAKILKPLLMKHQKRKIFDASDIIRAYKKIAFLEAMKFATKIDEQKNFNKKKNPTKIEKLLFDHKKSSVLEIELQENVKKNDNLIEKINTEELYKLFSQLLDRKISELQQKNHKTNLNIENFSAPISSISEKNYLENISSSNSDTDSFVIQTKIS